MSLARKKNRHQKRQSWHSLGSFHGFTMIELMVTVALFAIIVGLAVPALSQFVSNNSAITNANEFSGALQFARTEAIKRSQSTSVTAINSDWVNGYDVNLIEANGNATLLKQFMPVGTTTFASPQGANSVTAIQFAPTGLLQSPMVTFLFCRNTGSRGTEIRIGSTGRVVVETIEDCTQTPIS